MGARPVEAGPILGATAIVADLDTAAEALGRALGWSRSGPSLLPAETAHRWGAPALAGAASAVLHPPSGSGGWLRLVHQAGPRTPPPQPLRHSGWAALELLVRDVDEAMTASEETGFRVLGRPRRLGDGGKLPLTAGQVVGPDGIVLYLTQVLGDTPNFELPAPSGAIDGIFIAVLSALDLEESRAVLESALSVRRASDRRSPIAVVNSTLGLPPDTLHRLSTLQLSGSHLIEVDQNANPAAARRERPADSLPRGVAVLSLAASVPEPTLLEPAPGALVELLPKITE